MHYFIKIAACGLIAGQLAACNATRTLDMPQSTASTKNDSIGLDGTKVTFALRKLISDIDRGDPIFAFPTFPPTSGMFCNTSFVGDATVTYGGGKQYLGDWYSEFGKIFYETLNRKGYNVAGDPSDLFNPEKAIQSAEYLIGGRLLNMKGNFCQVHHWWDGRPLDEFSGEMFVEFEWSVLNSLTKEIVLKEKHSGYYKQHTPIKQGIAVTYNNAFADSAEKFAASDKLINLAKGINKTVVSSDVPSMPMLTIKNGKRQHSLNVNRIVNNLVTVRVGMGHGSGFFIGKKGYLLTNAHVVGTANKVQLKTSSGIEITADVIARDKIRDVALVKAPILNPKSLRLNRRLPKVADEVYAVGSPMSEELQSTVTKGIVSAIRRDARSELVHIQADVAISPGNSGGSLINSKGEVIGISVAAYVGEGAQNLNLFIPIGDALKALGITVKD